MITAGRPLEKFKSGLAWALEGAHDVLDIGTNRRFAKELAPLRPMFEGRNYRAAGFRPDTSLGEDSCDYDLDLCRIDQPDGSWDCVICLEVLEHVKEPFEAAKEIVRILRPGGRLFLTVPFLYTYHGHKASHSGAHGDYPDYWRFTHQGLERMFGTLDELRVEPLDGPVEFRVRSTPLIKVVDRFPLRNLLDRFDWPAPGKATTRHMVTGEKPR